jgi:hypothetical protein
MVRQEWDEAAGALIADARARAGMTEAELAARAHTLPWSADSLFPAQLRCGTSPSPTTTTSTSTSSELQSSSITSRRRTPVRMKGSTHRGIDSGEVMTNAQNIYYDENGNQVYVWDSNRAA